MVRDAEIKRATILAVRRCWSKIRSLMNLHCQYLEDEKRSVMSQQVDVSCYRVNGSPG